MSIIDKFKDTDIIEVKAAGEGGHGIKMLGEIMAYSGILSDLFVTNMISYGPEQRRGTCNFGDKFSRIGRPASYDVAHPHILIIFNEDSRKKFTLPEYTIKADGLIIYNTSLIETEPVPLSEGIKDGKKAMIPRTDYEAIGVPFTDIAEKIRKETVEKTGKEILVIPANMVSLGSFVGLTELISLDKAIEGMKIAFNDKPQYHEFNIKAIVEGLDYSQKFKK